MTIKDLMEMECTSCKTKIYADKNAEYWYCGVCGKRIDIKATAELQEKENKLKAKEAELRIRENALKKKEAELKEKEAIIKALENGEELLKPSAPATPTFKVTPSADGVVPTLIRPDTVLNNPNMKFTNLADTSKKAEPVQPAQKAPATPAKPAVPANPATPVKPAVPVNPATPVKPAVPVNPATPVKPAVPVNPATPAKPAVPVNPATPVKTAENVPAKPATPVKPAEQSAPATDKKQETSLTKNPDSFKMDAVPEKKPELPEPEENTQAMPVKKKPKPVDDGKPKEFEMNEHTLVKYNSLNPKISNVYLPGNVWRIGSGAFKDNKNITSVVCGDNIKEIADSAFMGCSELAEITLSNEIKKINYKTFNGCDKLKTITIPESVTEIMCDSMVCGLEEIVLNNPRTTWEQASDFADASFSVDKNGNGKGVSRIIFKGTEYKALDVFKHGSIANYFKANGLCQYCGAKFSFVNGKCPNCKTKKDY